MIQLTPIAIAATSQQYAARIVENLCSAFCLTDAIQPTGNVTYSVSSIKVVNGTAFVTIAANGSIQYVPKGCNPCRVRSWWWPLLVPELLQLPLHKVVRYRRLTM